MMTPRLSQSFVLLISVGLVFGLFFKEGHLIQKAWAQPQRLAVLEVQGEIGLVSQRQAWSDRLRAIALNLLKETEVMVLDRTQFEELLDPSKDLAACVGLCEVQIAREVGAHWSLSARLSISPTSKKSKTYTLTLKLHQVSDGALLSVTQEQELLLPQIQTSLKKLASRALTPILTRFKTLGHTLDTQRDHAQADRQEIEDASSDPLQQSSGDLKLSWQRVSLSLDDDHKGRGHRGVALCVSQRVTSAQYRACVDQGVCTSAQYGGKCRGRERTARVINCVDAQQAVLFAQWSGGRLLDESEWSRMIKTCPQCLQRDTPQAPLEWVVEESSQKIELWHKKISALNSNQLRRAPKGLVIGVKRGRTQRRNLPLSFRVSDVGFRVVFTTSSQKCDPPL